MEEAKCALHRLAPWTEDECYGGDLGKDYFLKMEAESMGRVCQGRHTETQMRRRQYRRGGKGK